MSRSVIVSRSVMRLLLLLVITSVIALSGCTAVAPVAAPAADAGGAAATSDEPVTIRLRTYTLGDTINAALQELVDQFEAENPNIKVELELPPNGQY